MTLRILRGLGTFFGRTSLLRGAVCAGVIACCMVAVAGTVARVPGDSGRIHWEPVAGAHLTLDDKTPLTWNIFQPDKSQKKKNLVLVLLGRRYIALDIRARVAYLILLTDLKAQGSDFESDEPESLGRVLPSSDWIVRDVGPAELIKLTLQDYGRTLQVTLPHPVDLRPLFTH
jgi:hypothetical protein